MLDVIPVKAFNDNYIWLIRPAESNSVIIIDPGDETPVFEALETHGLVPAAIFCTHGCHDHMGGIAALCSRFELPVYGSPKEKVAAVTHNVQQDDVIELLGLSFRVIDVPGHTSGHVAFYGHGMVFCGDSLFSAGCGRLYTHRPDLMFESLQKLSKLPANTLVYCAHEYTLDNLAFAETVEPDNGVIRSYIDEIAQKRHSGKPSLPSTIAKELDINPFLRTREPSIQAAASEFNRQPLASEADVFAALRRWKDGFRR